jgi:hypothetical protein
VDWEQLVALADRQKLTPLLYYRLAPAKGRGTKDLPGVGSVEPEGLENHAPLPRELLEVLRLDYHHAVARWLAASPQIGCVLGTLSAAGVPVVVFKGPAVSACYPNPALRLFGDLDLLVPPEELDRAASLLIDQGYGRGQSDLLPPGHGLPRLAMRDRNGSRIAVDLHRRLDDPDLAGRLPVEDLWARAEPWSFAGEPALRLDAVDAVLHLCWHGIVEDLASTSLRLVCDVAYLTAHWQCATWDTLLERAIDYGLGRALYLLLFLMDQTLGTSVPQGALKRLRALGHGPLALTHSDAFLREEIGFLPPNSIEPSRVWSQGSLRTRVAYGVRRLFLPRKQMAMIYDVPVSSPRIWFTYLWRPLEMVRRYGAVAWAVARGEASARGAWQRDVWLQRWLRGDVE